MVDYCISSHPAGPKVRWSDLALGILRQIQALAAMPGQWRQRAADLRHLRALEDHVLADMGLSRAEVEREARSPFWRPLLMIPGTRQGCNAGFGPQ